MDLNNLKSNQNCLCSSSGSVASVTSSSSRSSNGIPDKQGLRTIHLRRECGIYLEGNGKAGNKLYPNVKPNSFGFSVRGGREFGTGFFVSAVEKDSEAQYKGLKVGDQIVRINGLSVDDATHREVLQLAQSRHQLTLTVKSVGIIPVKDKSDDPVTWKLVDPGTESHHHQGNGFSCDVDRILIEIPESTQLGCGICKGPDWRPGIFIQYTKPNSLARRCGLQPGDQILQCNRISFLHIDFSYAVTVLKNSRTLDLILKKGSGIDLFPGESSGYSSSSSVTDEIVNQSPPKSKRLSIVAEEGDERSLRKSSCQCKGLRTSGTLKSSGSVDSIFDNVSNEGSTYREKSKSIEILTTDANDRKTVTFQNGENVSKTFLNFSEMPGQRFGEGNANGGGGSRQTVIKIVGKDGNKPIKPPTLPPPCDGLISVEVHRSNEDYDNEKTVNEKTSSISSYSSGCSLSSAISREIQKRNERRLKGNTVKQEKPDLVKPANRQQRHQHDLLIAELKKKQGWEDKSNVSTRTEAQSKESGVRSSQVNGTQKVPEIEAESGTDKEPTKGINGLKSGCKVPVPETSPPVCPTPDYYSDASLNDQSNETSQIVKTSILKFEEKNNRKNNSGRKAHQSNGVHKTVTFGQNSTKEITPLKNPTGKHSNHATQRHHSMMADKKCQDRVEMQSIESLDLTEPKKVAPKPPSVYFQPTVRPAEKRTTVIKITEYPSDRNRREPAKFDFINRSSTGNSGFDNELASTLLRSNLKNKTDAFANYSNNLNNNNNNSDSINNNNNNSGSNGTVIKIGNEKPANGVIGRFNGFHTPMPGFIPAGITESQISNAKKALKTFEKTAGNTIVLKIPKIN